MAGKRNKGLADAIFEGLIGGMVKVLSGWLLKFGGVVIIIALIYFLVS